MDHPVDIAVIGAGAAGLAAGIFACETARRNIAILDGAQKLGAKILVSGGGRCNVTHHAVSPEDFNGPRNIVRNVLRRFDERRTVEWFASMDVALKREPTGKLFPATDSARTVVDALLRRCEALGIRIASGHRVTDIRIAESGGFDVVYNGGTLRAARVIMATGGRSLPKTGSDGTGWNIVEKLGHTVTPTYPALVPLVLDEGFFHSSVKGVSHDVELSTFGEGKRIDVRTGSILWTHFGISGPVAMDASRFWVIAHAQGQSPELRLSFLPGETFEVCDRWLLDTSKVSPKKTLLNVIGERVPRSIAGALLAYMRVDGATPTGRLSRDARRRLVHGLTALALPVVRDRGWNYAEVTAGGVPLSEVETKTMRSRIVSGLYLVGEILDCEGRIGGFNFQWAWATGHIAGCAAGSD